MVSLSAFLVLVFLAFGYTDVIVQERTVTFQRQENGRFWPMPDNYNPGILMVHGRHCYDIMVKTANKTGEMTKMHREHCHVLLKNIMHLFDSNPSYRVDQWICEALTGQRWQGKAQNLLAPDNGLDYGIHYADATKNPAPKPQNLLAPDNGLDYGIKYDDKKKPASKPQNLLSPDNGLDYGIHYADATKKLNPKPQNLLAPDNGLDYGIHYADATKNPAPKPQNLLAPDNGLDYGIKYDDKKRPAPKPQNLLAPDNGLDYGIHYAPAGNGFTRSMAPGVVKGEEQDITFIKLMSDNFGDLLMNNFTNPQSITQSESRYLAQWNSDAAINLGAVGLYCHVKGNLAAIREMANAQI